MFLRLWCWNREDSDTHILIFITHNSQFAHLLWILYLCTWSIDRNTTTHADFASRLHIVIIIECFGYRSWECGAEHEMISCHEGSRYNNRRFLQAYKLIALLTPCHFVLNGLISRVDGFFSNFSFNLLHKWDFTRFFF